MKPFTDSLLEFLFADMSTLVGHFVSSPIESKKRDRTACRLEEKNEKQTRKRGLG